MKPLAAAAVASLLLVSCTSSTSPPPRAAPASVHLGSIVAVDASVGPATLAAGSLEIDVPLFRSSGRTVFVVPVLPGATGPYAGELVLRRGAVELGRYTVTRLPSQGVPGELFLSFLDAVDAFVASPPPAAQDPDLALAQARALAALADLTPKLRLLVSMARDAPVRLGAVGGEDVVLDADGLALADEVLASLLANGADPAQKLARGARSLDLATALPIAATLVLLPFTTTGALVAGIVVGTAELITMAGFSLANAYGSSGLTGDAAKDGQIADARDAVYGTDGSEPSLGDLPARSGTTLADATVGGPLEPDGRTIAELVAAPPAPDLTVRVRPSAVEVEAGAVAYLSAAVLLPDGSPISSAVTWTSDHPAVATVVNGVVRAVAKGYATVYATEGSTGRAGSAFVHVYELCGDVRLQDGNVCCPDLTQGATCGETCGGVALQPGNFCCADGSQGTSCPLRVVSCDYPLASQCFEEGGTVPPDWFTLTPDTCTGSGGVFTEAGCPSGAVLSCPDPESATDWWLIDLYYPPKWTDTDTCGP